MRNVGNRIKEKGNIKGIEGIARARLYVLRQHMAYMQLKTEFLCFNCITLLATGLYHCIGCQYTKFLAGGTKQIITGCGCQDDSWTQLYTCHSLSWQQKRNRTTAFFRSWTPRILHPLYFLMSNVPHFALVCASKGHAVRPTRSLIVWEKTNRSHTVL